MLNYISSGRGKQTLYDLMYIKNLIKNNSLKKEKGIRFVTIRDRE